MKKFAVFDIDGTLIRWQLYHAITNNLAKKGLLGEGAFHELKRHRAKWKNREHTNAFKDYERQVVRLFDSSITNIDPNDLQTAIDEVVHEYKNQTYSYTRDLITELRKRKYFLLAISGSQTEIVGPIAKEYGFDDFIGSTYHKKAGRFTGEKEIVALDKQKALNSLIVKHSLNVDGSIGIGDTESDIPVLEKVDVPIVFNPERKLYDKAIENGWKIVIERKNVIYELEEKNGSYVLAETNES